MNKTLPNTEIRKYLYNTINSTIPIFDTRVTGIAQPSEYILMTTQTADVDKGNKCEYRWDASILLDFVVRLDRQGNPGSRLDLDDNMDTVRDLIETAGITLGEGLEVIWYNFSFPSGITSVTDTEVVQRGFIRIELKIN